MLYSRSNAKLSEDVMTTPAGYEKEVEKAVETIRNYVTNMTGEECTDAELARALTRYFVMKEICEHIEMHRENPEW